MKIYSIYKKSVIIKGEILIMEKFTSCMQDPFLAMIS